MLHAKAYKNDDKARLHEKLPELAEEISKRTGNQDVELDSYIISATPYKELQERYDDGTWDKKQFEEKHILFSPSESEDYEYIEDYDAEEHFVIRRSIRAPKQTGK